MKPPLARCPKCKGTGKFPLGQGLVDTLSVVKSHGRITAPDVHDLIQGANYITVTAINQRLEDLRRLGLIDRRREGKAFVYFITEK